MGITLENIQMRILIWQLASEMIDPIIERHGLADQNKSVMFAQVNPVSKVHQHIEEINQAAEWLMKQR